MASDPSTDFLIIGAGFSRLVIAERLSAAGWKCVVVDRRNHLGGNAYDTIDTEFRELAAVERRARASRRQGFAGKLAIHPAQIAIINAAFTPSAAEIAHAEAIIAAFGADPTAGVLSINGRMVDRPHLLQAQGVLARAR